MEQSLSGKANRFSASQEIPRILWKPKVHYRVYKGLPPVPMEPDQSSPYPATPFTEEPSQYYPPIYVSQCHKIRNKFRINQSNI